MQKKDDDLEKKISGLNKDMSRLNQQIKRATGPTQARLKQQAMTLLQRRRMYENQKNANANTLFNIDQIAFQLSSVKDTQTSLSAMQTANATLKQETKKLVWHCLSPLAFVCTVKFHSHSHNFSTPHPLLSYYNRT
jgi:chromosome segregation ATPase